jgi:hypothetical protein
VQIMQEGVRDLCVVGCGMMLIGNWLVTIQRTRMP